MATCGLWNVPDHVLVRRKTRKRDPANGKWRTWVWDKNPVLVRDTSVPPNGQLLSYTFQHGGRLHISLGLLSQESQTEITQEVMGCDAWFRSYPIQGVEEPRVHFLLHKDATDDFTEPQPGYKYRVAALKARPLSKLPRVAELADKLQEVARSNGIATNADPSETFWNLGVDTVLYRDGKDKMGQHRDNAQGEALIFTVLAQCAYRRRILIESNDTSVRFELFLSAGDGYCMDSEMQKHYTHGVPGVVKKGYKDLPRIALVFRRGDRQMLENDSGMEVTCLTPRGPTPPRQFGHINGLSEGHNYSSKEMVTLKAHDRMQVGVSGNRSQGCDSVLVASQNGPDEDSFFEFEYKTEQTRGGYRLDTSARDGKPIRVFRSSKSSNSPFRALSLHNSVTMYRFDGLYHAKLVKTEKLNKNAENGKEAELTVYHTYRMVRANQGSSPWENRIENSSYIQYCVDRNTMLKLPEPLARVSGQRTPFQILNKVVELSTACHRNTLTIANDQLPARPIYDSPKFEALKGKEVPMKGAMWTHAPQTAGTNRRLMRNKKAKQRSKMRKQFKHQRMSEWHCSRTMSSRKQPQQCVPNRLYPIKAYKRLLPICASIKTVKEYTNQFFKHK
jgi:alkylated DNA repair dioxygenase AlkB